LKGKKKSTGIFSTESLSGLEVEFRTNPATGKPGLRITARTDEEKEFIRRLAAETSREWERLRPAKICDNLQRIIDSRDAPDLVRSDARAALLLAVQVRDVLDGSPNEIVDAMRRAVQVGMLLQRINVRPHEKDAGSGRAAREGGRIGNRIAYGDSKARDALHRKLAKEAFALKEVAKGRTWASVDAEIAAKESLSPKTVQRARRKYRKKF
jgi:hypothetical protein